MCFILQEENKFHPKARIYTILPLQIIANGTLGNPGPLIAQRYVKPMLGGFGSAYELSYVRREMTAHALDNPMRKRVASVMILA